MIEAGLEEPISVATITEQFEKSTWHFQRLFRSVVGVSMGQYLRQRRLSEAAIAICQGEARLLDVALRFDFGSQEAFTRAFKQEFGLTPSDYRDETKPALPNTRNRITPEKLEYFWKDVQRTPQIVEMPERILVGTQIDFKSYFIESDDCARRVLPHWIEFLKIFKNIPNRVGKEFYGVILSSEQELREETLSYVAATEVSDASSLADPWVTLTLPAGTYASFENIGLADRRTHVVDYIYGIWLPTSNYERAPGYDTEIFDQRYRLDDPASLSRILIPVRQNTR